MEPRWRGRSEGSAPLSLVLAFAHPGACKWKAICSSFNVRLGPPSYCFHDNIATALVKDCQCSFLLSVDSIHHNKYSLVSVCIRDIAPYYELVPVSAVPARNEVKKGHKGLAYSSRLWLVGRC
eukprot:1149672-Pelagomonas_calceolata.AAC.1